MANGLFEQIQKNTKEKLPAEWAKLLTPGTAQYEAAVLLNAQGKLPSLKFASIPEVGVNGIYSKTDNALTLDSSLNANDLPNTIAHELTHALTTAMQKTAGSILDNKTKPTALEQQFMNAWYKLDPDFSKLAKFKYTDREYNQYRHSSREAPAWAVGRMEDPRQTLTQQEYFMSSPGGSHVDATLATEQAILRDLYARKILQEQQPETPWWKDPFGFSIK